MPSQTLEKAIDHPALRSAVISVRGLHKYYDLGETRVHALRGVNVDIQRGEFVAIMGASGSGKSTFMNILGSLDLPSSGSYRFEGIEVATLSKGEIARLRNQTNRVRISGIQSARTHERPGECRAAHALRPC